MEVEYFELSVTWSDNEHITTFESALDNAYGELERVLKISEDEKWDKYPTYAVIQKCTNSGKTPSEIALAAANRRHKTKPQFHWKRGQDWKPYFEEFE